MTISNKLKVKQTNLHIINDIRVVSSAIWKNYKSLTHITDCHLNSLVDAVNKSLENYRSWKAICDYSVDIEKDTYTWNNMYSNICNRIFNRILHTLHISHNNFIGKPKYVMIIRIKPTKSCEYIITTLTFNVGIVDAN